jgi:hypothetical protein
VDVLSTPDEGRSGLKGFSTGKTHKVYLLGDPDPSPGRSIPGALFAFDSAFPGPGMFLHLKVIDDEATGQEARRLVVFGHADPKGGDVYNKGLSDRRARAVLALLTNDRPAFDAIALHDRWGVKHYQAMLRGVGCNPGAIDGIAGPLLSDAVRAFQEEYNDGVFHEGSTPRAHGDLMVNGELDEPTKAAIRDAYVVGTPGDVPAGRFAGPRFGGCSDFNLVSSKDEENRRVVIAFFGDAGQRPLDREFPCKEGDAAACKVDGARPMRCKFYRKAVKEVAGPPVKPFFDFHWLRQKNGVAHLSALTTLPDGVNATFTVYRCTSEKTVPGPELTSIDGTPRPTPGEVLATVEGKIVGGVCFAKWTPPPDDDPFDRESWQVVHEVDMTCYEAEDSAAAAEDSLRTLDGLLAATKLRPPVFAIDSGEHWGFSRPPGARLNRIRIKHADAQGYAFRSDGGVVAFASSNGRIQAPDTIDVLCLAFYGSRPGVGRQDGDGGQT